VKPILEIKKISKRYKIHHEGRQSYHSLRDKISNIFKRSIKGQGSDENFWALKEVSFDVYPGECIGIIGRNGAGKSTLLKILSKITPPTEGKIICRGRVASLLEVGTGFHPELTGRENIYLNGSILGLKKVEIERQFNDIVDFSGVEKFLDTSLKHYSSGMQLRLAFAVAAHLEPEILIIDEVLAVGDAEFQKKCMGKMGEVSKSGRTVLFVSHNLAALASLCPKSILLKNGSVVSYGPTQEIINEYLGESKSSNRIWNSNHTLNEFIEIKKIEIDSGEGENFTINSNLFLKVNFISKKPIVGIAYEFFLTSLSGELIFTFSTKLQQLEMGNVALRFEIPGNLLNDGTYTITFGISQHFSSFLAKVDDAVTFEVLNVINENEWSGKWPGAIRPKINWQLNYLKNDSTNSTPE
jgi:lipopolysaccharide transport system ATP-binding protein